VLFDVGEHTLAFGVLHGRGRYSGVTRHLTIKPRKHKKTKKKH
jgi:hypothetical protein